MRSGRLNGPIKSRYREILDADGKRFWMVSKDFNREELASIGKDIQYCVNYHDKLLEELTLAIEWFDLCDAGTEEDAYVLNGMRERIRRLLAECGIVVKKGEKARKV